MVQRRDLRRSRLAVPVWHLQVHDDDVWSELGDDSYGGTSVAGLADDSSDIRDSFEHSLQSVPNDLMIAPLWGSPRST
jgi:hypothetical protein